MTEQQHRQALPPSPWDMVLAAINRVETRLDRLVSIEVHQADLRRVDARLDDLVSDVGMERAARAEIRGEMNAQIDALTKAIVGERDARVASVRWGIGTVIVAVAAAAAVLGLILG